VALLVGAAASVLVLRRWKHTSAKRDEVSRAAPLAADDPYVLRVQEHLKEYE